MMGMVAATLLLSGCEEPMAPDAPPKSKTPTAAPLYTEIGAAELLERWSVLPGGAVAAGANPSGRRRAAATEGFEVLPPRFQFSDAREYGACVVFTAKAEPIPNMGAWYGTMHIIDCVGNPHEKNPVPGLFHTALMCISTTDTSEGYSTGHIIRAGHFDPATHPHPWGDGYGGGGDSGAVHGHASVQPGGESRSSGLYGWGKYIEFEEGKRVLVNWALEFHGDYYREDYPGGGSSGWTVAKIELFPFDQLESSEELHFQVDHSRGVVKVEANDGAAFAEYRGRCESIPPGQ